MSSSKTILAINAGSSSLKVSIFSAESDTPNQLAEIEISGLSSPPATLKYSRGDEKIKGKELENVKNQGDALDYILDHLMNDDGLPQLKDKEDIEFACHRVVHGGDYSQAQVINRDTYHHIERLSDLAPLHNASALSLIKSLHETLPSTINLAFFDTTFHSTIPRHISTYPVPQSSKSNNLRKYGFHGLSYASILRSTSSFLKKPPSSTSLIALHLGSGASACAIRNGKSLDTSMGLTPLSGLPGATRSGDVDPALVFHMTNSAGDMSASSTKELHITQAEEMLNKKCGWNALTGTTDFGAVIAGEREEDKLAVDILVDRIIGLVGAYFVRLGGEVDALVFAGGIGEKGAELRNKVVDSLRCLGFAIDEGKNGKVGDGVVEDVGSDEARYKVLVCRTDEQAEMARGCLERWDEFKKG
ncbi:acetate kinase [Aulographum hederae CBS 113979]|uniref:Probable acetate kinase n=1 Tax=Aulographum hederae CBS 113979 TaxID=1176131 RepID=A0A6G1GQI2_9PEZI|nr:acetate kinase [Aulographum hederae CBS 113979]